MADSPLYSRLDIQRYLQHRMSLQEMHAFEKALMDDPFLADALDGFASGDAAKSEVHLNTIEQQIKGQKETSKIVPFTIAATNWWKVAAMVLVIASGAALSYSLLNNRSNPQVAAQQKERSDTTAFVPPAAATPPIQTPPVKQDTTALVLTSPSATHPAAAPQAAKAQDFAGEAKTDTLRVSIAGRTADMVVTDSAVVQRQMIEPESRMRSMKPAPAPVLYGLKGRVTDTRGEAVAFATILDTHTHAKAISDEKGYFILNVSDSVANVTIQTPNYTALNAMLSSKQQLNTVILHENAQPLSEVGVGYGAVKAKNTSPSSDAEPVGGWKNFRQYLNRKVDSLRVKDRRNLFSNQDVVLEFLISEEGRPSDIKVKEQVSKEAADKAVEILTDGPKWNKNKKDRRVKVVIPFGSAK